MRIVGSFPSGMGPGYYTGVVMGSHDEAHVAMDFFTDDKDETDLPDFAYWWDETPECDEYEVYARDLPEEDSEEKPFYRGTDRYGNKGCFEDFETSIGE